MSVMTTERRVGTAEVKRGLADLLSGGVIMGVTSAAQAQVAEEAGAVALVAFEHAPADIRHSSGIARMSDPRVITAIREATSLPVMAKIRIGHVAEARVLAELEVDYIDESEVLTPADTRYIDKQTFRVPFVCGAASLGEALMRVHEGAALIRTKGEAGTGDIAEAAAQLRTITEEIAALREEDATERAEAWNVPLELVHEVIVDRRLPVPLFGAGGVATPADAAWLRQLGAQAIIVTSGIFTSDNPSVMAASIVLATAHWENAAIVAKAAAGVGPMPGMGSGPRGGA